MPNQNQRRENQVLELSIPGALDPSYSVVVEACAGSGKTWLLASRIICLLLNGIAPGEILAITFTRKAAREIEERVVGWLHFLATGTKGQVVDFLDERGVSVDERTIDSARGLYERVLTAQPRLTVNTFHGWFLQLLDTAPLSANLAGKTLIEPGSRFFDELYQSFATTLSKAPESDLTRSFVELLDLAGLDSTQRLLRRAFDRRSEWLALDDVPSRITERVISSLRDQLGVVESGKALVAFFSGNWVSDFEVYLDFLKMSELSSDQKAASNLDTALAKKDNLHAFDCLCRVFLTQDNTLRDRKASKKLDARFTPQGARRFLDLHVQLGERILFCLEQQTAERTLALNQRACAVFAAFLGHVDEFKRARRQMDFVDVEWDVLRLLRDEDTAAFLQVRLDSRYRQVLLDEFQDTNPLQWQILMTWLSAYSDAARPVVFLVGDPKQSIYRFRRAEPRLFSVAADFLVREFSAIRYSQDRTRRNALPIIDVINEIFRNVPEFAPFREQSSAAGDLPGYVEILPLFKNDEKNNEQGDSAEKSGNGVELRNPLMDPDNEPEDLRRRCEAEALAAKISEVVGRSGPAWQIESVQDGASVRRPVSYGDIMLLVRSRTHLACYERALSAMDIPFDAGSRGGLLETLEVRDIVALLEFLVSPVDSLKLAHALRSPIFACRDEELTLLAKCEEPTWWQRLVVMEEEGAATARLSRAVRLLGEWLTVIGLLPAHDLLDRIYHQGEVFARYRLAVPPAIFAGVEANLRALLLLALDVDSGRYPSLPRFIDELHDLRDAEANDAPDEGEIATQAEAQGRVRILTIHGAKGLEAPIVWLLGANELSRASDAWGIIVDWPPESEGPHHFSFYGRKEEHGLARQAIFASEAAAARREEFNLLYVAITRARQVFIASGIEGRRDKSDTAYRLLEAALSQLGGQGKHGELPSTDDIVGELQTFLSPITDAGTALPPVGEQKQKLGVAERFGILLHALLERRTDKGETEKWWESLGFSEEEYQRVRPIADRLMTAPDLRRFFEPSQYLYAWNELELTDGAGVLMCIDRLVEFDDSLWVIDYKSSASDIQWISAYKAQVTNYCHAVTGIFQNTTVHGAVIFSDATLLEVV